MVPVQELFLESILNTYQMFCVLGKNMKQFQRVDPELYPQVLKGEIDLKVLCWSKLKDEFENQEEVRR
jgi:hypothetical protein